MLPRSVPALLLCALVAALVCCTASHAQPLPLPALPYAYTALSPVLSEATLRAHHLGHFQAYATRINSLLTTLRERGGNQKALAKRGLDYVLAHLDQVDEDLRTLVRNHGGGYVNHDLFFSRLSAPTLNGTDVAERAPEESSAIGQALSTAFGGFSQFQARFTELATANFGSSWVFLYVDGKSGELALRATSNQDSPSSIDGDIRHVHLLALDQWEHAYYLDYQFKRAEWVAKWWTIVDWNAVDLAYESFLTYQRVMDERVQKGKEATEKDL